MSSKLKNLWVEHGILETKIEREQRRPMSDQLRLSSLKRMKLAVKDEIAKLETRLQESGTGRRDHRLA